MNPEGSYQTDLSNHWSSDVSPKLSPDGSKIAFLLDRDGYGGISDYEVYGMNADGSDQIRITDSGGDYFGYTVTRYFH